MAITLHPPENPQRFRVTRTWKGVEYQAFVPFGKNINKARKDAEILDEKLAQRQRAYLLRRELEGLHVLHPDGRIIGLQRQQRIRDRRKPTDTFKIRLAIDGNPPLFKDFEINAKRSFDEAFRLSVQLIAELRGVEKDGVLYKKMLSAKSIYENRVSNITKIDSMEVEEQEWFQLLSQEVAHFEQRNRRVIKG